MMVSRRRFLGMAGLAGATAAAVAVGVAVLPDNEDDASNGPPAIRYNKDSCAMCTMVIADVRFAAAWRDGTGKASRFDDIGCMIALLRRQDPGAGTTYYVHDFGDESWLEAPAASFVLAESIMSPMAYGLAALATPAAAEKLAAEDKGEVLTWEQTIAKAKRRGSM